MHEKDYYFFALEQAYYDERDQLLWKVPLVYAIDVNDSNRWDVNTITKESIEEIKNEGYSVFYTGDIPKSGEFYGVRKEFSIIVDETFVTVVQNQVSKNLEEMIKKEGLKVEHLGELPDTSLPYFCN